MRIHSNDPKMMKNFDRAFFKNGFFILCWLRKASGTYEWIDKKL